ncbi:MAG TPA: ferritin-like domain-containing protein [Polyangiaceae bacterium]
MFCPRNPGYLPLSTLPARELLELSTLPPQRASAFGVSSDEAPNPEVTEMNSQAWLDYFEHNRTPRSNALAPEAGASLLPELRAALIHSLQCFQIGEVGEGRVVHQVAASASSVFDDATRRAIDLYVREEGRHARELSDAIVALGARPLGRHWSALLFKRCRRLLGVQTKLMSMAAAEIVGGTLYELVRDRVPCASLSRVMAKIAADEARHLDFQAELFGRIARRAPRALQAPYALWLSGEFALILAAAIATVAFDHRCLLALLDVSPAAFARACLRTGSARLPLLASRPASPPELATDGVG